MLLPSALPCEARPALLRRPQYSSSQPKPSIETATSSPSRSGNGLLGTCRALQALLTSSPSRASSPGITTRPNRLQSPAPISQKPTATRPHKIVKAPPKSSRGAKKRRRDVEDDGSLNQENENGEGDQKFSTPKRQRRVPDTMPLGLSRSDFDALSTPCLRSPRRLAPCHQYDQPPFQVAMSPVSEQPPELNTGNWAPEDDTLLVDVVLGKLKLTKRDWNECARKIGKDDDSVGKRWKALVGEGEVGLRRGSGKKVRPGLKGVWR